MKLQQSSRERRKAGLSLLDGVHLVRGYLEHVGVPETIVVGRSHLDDPEIVSLIHARGMPEPIVLPDALFCELSAVATPTGILVAVKTPRPPARPATPGPCVMLEDIQDPGNLGSILRTTAAAGIDEVYLSRACVQAWSPRVLRAGMGAHFVVNLYEGVDLVGLAASYPGKVFAAAHDGALPLYSADLRGTVALVLGNEGAGLTPGMRGVAHATLSIPMPGKAESLNVAAAAAICLFERVRQLRAVNSEE